MINRRTFVATALAAAMAGAARPATAANDGDAARELEESESLLISKTDYKLVKPQYRVATVDYQTAEAPGTIIIDVRQRYLYFILGGGKARRYGVGVGKQGFEWSGEAVIRRKAKWPKWTPPKDMIARDPEAAKWPNGMPGGPHHPLGARALYLFQGDVDTLYRIHGTREPRTIGSAVSSGCIRLLNADVVDLYERVGIGAKVIVLGGGPEFEAARPHRQVNLRSNRDR